ncbi:hypothetical protein BH09BAC3_BH09BAC3_33750 [soil metagenome]
MRLLLLIIGFLMLFSAEILRVYYIMPFPGSQEAETIQIAYWISSNIVYIRLIGLALVIYPFFYFFQRTTSTMKVILCVVFGFYAVVFYMFNYLLVADSMFIQLKNKVYLDAAGNKVRTNQLVLGISINNESKAYPIEVIGYHHQVRDVVGGEEVMVTYCTVCRAGRVFSPVVNGMTEKFRLVGMDHYNAMFEDVSTKSWWRQVNGEAIIGELKGKTLNEIPSSQMTLAEWIDLYPDTKVLQPDTIFAEAYKGLEDYDEGKRTGRLERKDSLSWKDKSWIVGMQVGMDARAYDWIELQKLRVINDVVGGTPVVVALSPDSISHHSYSRRVDTETLVFSLDNTTGYLIDSKTNSRWKWNGKCVEGPMVGKELMPIQSYQEYWHSWKIFHSQTKQFVPG